MRVRWIVVAAAVTAVLAGVATAAAAPFTPKTLAGTWTGTWTNTTFGSTGSAKFVVRSLSGNTKLSFTTDFGGSVFGCQDPAGEQSKPMTKGTGKNRWNAAGFRVVASSKAFGSLDIRYASATRKLTGTGINPPCRGGLKWKLAGTFAGKKFTGTVTITLPDGTPAASTLSLKRP